MINNSHNNESYAKRLARFQNNSPSESIETLLGSVANYFNNEIAVTVGKYQTSLLFLGIHAVALTISEVFWGLRKLDGYKKFLEEFVDGDTDDIKFSLIADKIHRWRNVLAHQWLASSGHQIQYDYKLGAGFSVDSNLLIINPQIYCNRYLSSFSAGGRIWDYDKILSDSELESAKQRIIDKFIKK